MSTVYEGVAMAMGWGPPSATDLANLSYFAQQLSAAEGQLPDAYEQLFDEANEMGEVEALLEARSPTPATVQQAQDLLNALNNSPTVLLDFSGDETNDTSEIQNYVQDVEDMASTPGNCEGCYYDFNVGALDIRGESDDGKFSVFLPSDTPIQLTVYQPVTGYAGVATFTTPPSGESSTWSVLVGPPQGPDNSNGMPEEIDQVFGQDVTPQDLALLQQGVNPFAGAPFATGVVADLPLQGEAQSVTLVGSPLNPQGQTAYVATGSYGLAIVDASQFTKPVASASFSCRATPRTSRLTPLFRSPRSPTISAGSSSSTSPIPQSHACFKRSPFPRAMCRSSMESRTPRLARPWSRLTCGPAGISRHSA